MENPISSEKLKLEMANRLFCRLYQCANMLHKTGSRAVEEEGLTTQQWAVYIASREGGCRFAAVNINPSTRDDSHCTFQLNVLSGTFGPRGELGRRGWTVAAVVSSLQACADAASDLWVYCGRGPWIPPYSCKPPWVGATVNQPPALLPPPPTSVVETPVAEKPVSESPVTEPPVAGVPTVPADTPATSLPAG